MRPSSWKKKMAEAEDKSGCISVRNPELFKEITVAQLIAKGIKDLQRQRDVLKFEIQRLVQSVVEDYCWLDHKISTFWTCDKSPVGMCIFNIDERGVHGCRYCGGPQIRK